MIVGDPPDGYKFDKDAPAGPVGPAGKVTGSPKPS